MQNQLVNQLPNQMPVQMGPQMMNPMMTGNQINMQMNGMGPTNQMIGPYSMGAGVQMQPSPGNPMGMQQHVVQHQQLSMQPSANPVPTPPAQPQQPQQSKELNTASLCRIGQETVQDIVSRTQEVFQTLKQIQPPNGTLHGMNGSNEKKLKVQEQFRTIRILFKRLRLIYEKCNENCQTQGMEYMHIESLIPLKDEVDLKHDEKKNSEAYRSACEECKDVMEQVVLKNKQLKDVTDHLRRIIWEINTMLTMRRS